MRIKPETKATIIATGVPLVSALFNAWNEHQESKAPEPEVVDTETKEPLATFDDLAVEQHEEMEKLMDKIRPEANGLVTEEVDGKQAIAWRAALPVLDHEVNFLKWGLGYLMRSGFEVPTAVEDIDAALTKACQDAVLDWHGVSESETPDKYR